VDLGSVAGLAVGATLPVVYSTAEPHAARLQAGTRGYARDLLGYLLLLSFGSGAALLLLGYPIVKLLGGASRRFRDVTRRDQSM
jgi:O-antigen/teichoic acid export membrane protein